MTISNQINRVSYTGNGTTTVFAFNATLLATADLTVHILDLTTEVETLQVEITDYTIALAGDFATATVTMIVAPAIGERLVLNRDQDYLQATDLINNDGVPADTVERMTDRTVLMAQRLQEQQDRSITLPQTSTLTGIVVEDFVDRAGQLFRVNGTEDGVDLVEIDLEVITEQQVTQLQKDIYNQIIDLTSADSPFTVLADDEGALYRCDTSTGAITINLPAMGVQTEDLKYSIVKQSGDANLVTYTASGSELISGLGSRTIGTRYAMVVVVGDLTNQEWFHQGTTQSLADINLDTFSGNASDTIFTLTADPISENNTWVTIDGAAQHKATYTVVGTTLTFSTAPPTGTNNIEVIYIETLAIGVPADNSVSTAKIVNGAVTLAKMADLAQDRILGRVTASTGVPEALTGANVVTVIGSALAIVNDTTPQLGGHLDVNGQAIGDGTLELLTFVEDASAINHLEIENQAVGGGPILRSTGDDTDVDLHLDAKGAGNVIVDDDLDVTGVVAAADGTVALPAFTFTSDTNTGIYNIGANNVGVACNGLKKLDIALSGSTFGDGTNHYVLAVARGDTTSKIPSLHLKSSDNTSYFLFFRDSGVLARHTAFPTSDTVGVGISSESFVIAASDETTVLTTGTKVTFRMPVAFVLTGVRASLTTAGSGATLVTVDINEGGTSILSTKLIFDDGAKTTVGAATPPVISDANLADDAEMTIDIDVVDAATTTAAGLKVTLIGYQS